LKLDNLVTQYLYQQKRLSLPGIGTFTTDGPAVQFDNAHDAVLSKDLIEFIKTHTGKMYSLAQSDLESYIMLNKQFLNIGKALYVEGIGTLVKAKDGSLEFTPGEMVAERMEELTTESRKPSAFIDETRYHPDNNARQKWFIGGLSLLTLVIVVWGGWRLFVNNDSSPVPEKKLTEPVADTVAAAVKDTNTIVADTFSTRKPDSLSVSAAVVNNNIATPQNSQWRFVIEQTNNKNRAYRRYNQLKEIGDKIQITTADSVTYKLYFQLPAMVSDTTRMRDSLRRFYGSRLVRVEK
jgi:hypothetical protein